jgi:molybdopterin synthase catalytic subunit
MISLQTEPLSLDVLTAAVADPEHGGVVTFIGQTRRESDGRAVAALDYEADEGLARTEMAAIASEAVQRFGARIAVSHRLGTVVVGEPSVAVAASAAHRPAAFAACRYVIDEVKTRVPIWKRTHFVDGGRQWIDGIEAEPVPHPTPEESHDG